MLCRESSWNVLFPDLQWAIPFETCLEGGFPSKCVSISHGHLQLGLEGPSPERGSMSVKRVSRAPGCTAGTPRKASLGKEKDGTCLPWRGLFIDGTFAEPLLLHLGANELEFNRIRERARRVSHKLP